MRNYMSKMTRVTRSKYFRLGPKKYGQYVFNARRRQKEMILQEEDFLQMFHDPCFYCGREVTEYELNGVDRVDNEKGYTAENTVACCAICNRMKGCLSVDVFFERIRSIYEKHGLR